MIECVFTIDYEIYGNGEGSLRDLVYEPTERLINVFASWEARFVAFVEVAELQKIEASGTDDAINDVRRQVRHMYERGFEVALHLHPQWFNAHYKEGKWLLDYGEYNLCRLSPQRITHLLSQSIDYLGAIVGVREFQPFSFRAGNWLLQPSANVASALVKHGIRLDSSVFKGGVQHAHNLDYRPAMRHGYFWSFLDDVAENISGGPLMEVPIHVRMVPFWRMLSAKRLNLQAKSRAAASRSLGAKPRRRFSRLRDFLRLSYPLKFDFCRMTLPEMTSMVERVIREDEKSPYTFKPLVAIGHSKDLVDYDTIEAFLSFLRARSIAVSTLQDIYRKCRQ